MSLSEAKSFCLSRSEAERVTAGEVFHGFHSFHRAYQCFYLSEEVIRGPENVDRSTICAGFGRELSHFGREVSQPVRVKWLKRLKSSRSGTLTEKGRNQQGFTHPLRGQGGSFCGRG